jgi:hypothetical protein
MKGDVDGMLVRGPNAEVGEVAEVDDGFAILNRARLAAGSHLNDAERITVWEASEEQLVFGSRAPKLGTPLRGLLQL